MDNLYKNQKKYINRLKDKGLKPLVCFISPDNMKSIDNIKYEKRFSNRSEVLAFLIQYYNQNSLNEDMETSKISKKPFLLNQDKILKIILQMRNDKVTYGQISDFLNSNGYTTEKNLKFSENIVRKIYNTKIKGD
jgi:hypothetical protein